MSKIVRTVYAIRNILNGLLYVGSSKITYERWSDHKTDLRHKRHHSPHLQRAWDKYGEKSFEFIVLEYVNKQEDLEVREQYWIDFYKSYERERGYNICSKAYRRIGISPWSKGKHLPPETIEKIRQSKLGKKLTEEHKRKISDAGKGRVFSDDHKQGIRESKLKFWSAVLSGNSELSKSHFRPEYWIALNTENKTLKELEKITGLETRQIHVYLKKFGLSFKSLITTTQFKKGQPAFIIDKPHRYKEFWMALNPETKT